MAEKPRYWDPDPLAVGDRVRVRLSGECPVPHYPEVDGLEGVMWRIYDDMQVHEHGYGVEFSEWIPEPGGGTYRGASFARSELVRL